MSARAIKWIANARHHGTPHPSLEAAYFSISAVGSIDSLSGYVSPAEFRRLARRFRVSPEIQSAVTIVNAALQGLGTP